MKIELGRAIGIEALPDEEIEARGCSKCRKTLEAALGIENLRVSGLTDPSAFVVWCPRCKTVNWRRVVNPHPAQPAP